MPIFRWETLQTYPQLQGAIAELAGKISSEAMQNLNYQVEGELRDVREVVQEFLQTQT